MPELQNVVSMPWKGTPGRVTAIVSMPWKGTAGRVQSLGGAYAAPASPSGGTAVKPGDLRAAAALAPATSYVQAHTVTVVDVRSGLPLEVDSVAITLQDESVFWQLSAAGQDSLFATLTTGEQPAVVEVTVDGHVWQFLVENVSRPRGSDSRRVQFGGRSVAAVADKPFSFPANYAIDAPTTAAQLAAGALQSAGVELEWKIEDWLIPAGTVSLTGTPLEIVRAIAAAVGATLTAHSSELKLTVESRYPTMPNEWAGVAPDVQIHSRAVRTETYDRIDQPAYTGVIVAGQQGGALGYARLEGTSGAELAPLVSDQLLTDAPALRERARAVLAAGGSKALVTRLLPVRTGAGEPGVLRRGALVRCVDQTSSTEIWHGMVRSVSVRAQFPVVEQTVTIERYTKHIIEPDTSLPLEFLGTIANQELEVGQPFSLDLTPYRSGGADPYAWAVRGGPLPPGLAVSGESIVGTPTAVASAIGMQMRVIDTVSRQLDSNPFNIVVLPDHRLLTLTFEDTLNCVTTSEAFTSFGSLSYDNSGAFGSGFGKALNVNGAGNAASRSQSNDYEDLWDLTGQSIDWVICGWFKLSAVLPTTNRFLVTIVENPHVSNTQLYVALLSTGGGANTRLNFGVPLSSGFLVAVNKVIPYDTNPHFFAVGRVGNTIYCSIDGSARSGADSGSAGGGNWSTSAGYRRPTGPRRVIVGNDTGNAAAFRGLLDNLQIIRGTPFDFVNGFTPPTGLVP